MGINFHFCFDFRIAAKNGTVSRWIQQKGALSERGFCDSRSRNGEII
jgi:hypothetical protein